MIILPITAATSAAAPKASALTALTNCRAIAENEARLACYDAAAAELDTAANKKDILVLDREDVRETRRSLFGFALPRVPLFGARDDNEEKVEDIEEITAKIRGARSLGYGKWQIVLEDGATWSTTEAVARREPKGGSTVVIRRKSMGSYMMKIDGDQGVRAKRDG
ncbi:hypothetical protein CLG96_02640 [Sphingomonas oleivorans]|uniref:Uncharacterized protein n=1 Tax=Sphingomonas oleivorans TaxID=1735121 RepID=A0A2T5G1N2_9SPHN|nr:hypothetical protein CLG96_02640 [Sphingomonas oleivorans]